MKQHKVKVQVGSVITRWDPMQRGDFVQKLIRIEGVDKRGNLIVRGHKLSGELGTVTRANFDSFFCIVPKRPGVQSVKSWLSKRGEGPDVAEVCVTCAVALANAKPTDDARVQVLPTTPSASVAKPEKETP
jgi:hypothetical protein